MNSSLNLIIFNIFWILITASASKNMEFISSLFVLLYVIIFWKSYSSDIKFISKVFVLGVVFDYIMSVLGFIQYLPSSQFIPIWLVGLWIIFAQAAGSFPLVFKNKFVLLIFFGFGGPLSYFYGTKVDLIVASNYLIWPIQFIFWSLLSQYVLKNKPSKDLK